MWDQIVAIVSTLDFWRYATIPFISALVGWVTNVLALRMTFYPLNFVGVWKIGWQGIIPSKAGDMAGKAVDLLTENLITVEDRFEQIEPERVAEEMEPILNRLTVKIVNETMELEAPVIWENTPKQVKQRAFQRISEDLPEVVEDLMEEVKRDISDLFDLRKMVVESLESDRSLLNQIFLEVGSAEFKFIERSGLYFGFLFGLVQMALFVLARDVLNLPEDYSAWTLPLAGLFVGWATNVIALRMIFEPLHPHKYGPFTVQGLFIKRQMEVAEGYAEIVSSRILTSQHIFQEMISGPTAGRLLQIIRLHVKQSIDQVVGPTKTLFQLTQGTRRYIEIKNRIAARFIEEIPHSIKYIFDYTEEAMDIRNTLKYRMQTLGPLEFVSFLRPVFQEDEWKLILVGAVLGFLAGLGQMFFVFGGL